MLRRVVWQKFTGVSDVFTLTKKAARTSKMSVNIYEMTWRTTQNTVIM
jgi:hypothetical protein